MTVLLSLLFASAAQGSAADSGAQVRMGDALYTHPGGITALARSPDGNLLVSAGADESIRIWDLSEGKLRTRFDHPEVAAEFVVTSVAGTRLATCGPDNRIHLWALPDGKPLAVLSETRRIVAGLAFAAGENLLVSARTDGSLALWDTSTASILKSWTAHRRGVVALAASLDGSRVATAAEKDGIAVWNTASGELVSRPEEASFVRSLAFSPDGRRLAAGTENGAVAVWDPASGRLEKNRPPFTPGKEAIAVLAFAPGGGLLAWGSEGGDLATWDFVRGTDHPLGGVPGIPMRALVYSGDGTTLVSGDAAGRIVYQAAASGDLRRASAGHRARIRALAYSPAGDFLASGGDDRTVKIWDAATGKELRALEGSGASITSLSYSPDGRRLVGTAQEPLARVWDAATGKTLRVLKGTRCGYTSAAWSPNGATVAVGATDGGLHLFDAEGAETALGDHTHTVTGLLYSTWTETLMSSSFDSTVRIWDLATRKESARFTVVDSMTYAMAASPDGRLLAAASIGRLGAHHWSPEHVLTIWDASTGQKVAELARFETFGPVTGRIEFAPDGRQVFVLRDGVLKSWSLPDGRERTPALKGGPATAFRFSPDGGSVALALADLTIAVLDVAAVAPPRPAGPDLDAAALDRHWDELARPEAERAFKGVCALADSPASAVAYLRARLVPVSLEEVEKLVGHLDDDDAAVRDRAARMIRVVGTPALLEQFLERKPPLETALRIRLLIADQKEMKGGAPELDRALRAVSVLEMAGTGEAKALLERLAAGTPSARQTEAARLALLRLAARRSR